MTNVTKSAKNMVTSQLLLLGPALDEIFQTFRFREFRKCSAVEVWKFFGKCRALILKHSLFISYISVKQTVKLLAQSIKKQVIAFQKKELKVSFLQFLSKQC